MHNGYHDIDACPTLDYLIQGRANLEVSKYFQRSQQTKLEQLFKVSESLVALTI